MLRPRIGQWHGLIIAYEPHKNLPVNTGNETSGMLVTPVGRILVTAYIRVTTHTYAKRRHAAILYIEPFYLEALHKSS